MSRFYVPRENVRENEIVVDGKEAHHILDVMRMRDGDKVVVFDGTGNEYTGFIKNVNTRFKKLTVEIVRTEKPSAESSPEVVLAQAIPKKNKMDYIVEKATELGASGIIPVVSERTIVRPGDSSAAKKVERWRKIAVEAAKQCGRQDVPEITDITDYAELIRGADLYDLILLACLRGDTVSIRSPLEGLTSGRILVLIGPEGDFTTEELHLADTNNCRFVSLGKRVMKSDTAGLFVLSILNYEFSL